MNHALVTVDYENYGCKRYTNYTHAPIAIFQTGFHGIGGWGYGGIWISLDRLWMTKDYYVKKGEILDVQKASLGGPRVI